MSLSPRLKLNMCCDSSVKNYYSNKESQDSGYDLYVPEDVVVPPHQTVKINHRVRCEIAWSPLYPDNIHGLLLYARSSIANTGALIVHNSVGVIDYAYRGPIIGAVHNVTDTPYTIKAGTRIMQLCAPDLRPMQVEFVDELSTDTERGEGGFGSTNKN